MKSKHKHELKTNELADALERLFEWSKPHARMISYGAVAVLALIIVLIIWPAIRGSAAQRNPAAEAFAEALDSGQVQAVRDFLADYPKAEQATVAKMLLADRLLAEVVRGVQAGPGEDPKVKAAKLLADAKDLYAQIAQQAPDQEPMARTGLALAMIQEGDLDKGLAALKEVTEKWPQTLGAQKAKANIESLAGYKPIEFSNEPLEEPKPPEEKPAETKAPEAAVAQRPPSTPAKQPPVQPQAAVAQRPPSTPAKQPPVQPKVAAPSSTSSTAFGDSPREIAKRVSPSVVLLEMEDSNGQPLAMGSGFVIKDGIVATNLHVVEGASRGYAKLADRKDKFNISGTVATDAARDIVLLAVEDLKAPALTLGDSKQVAVGDAVYAVGNPRRLEGTFSAGIISSIRKVGDDSLLQITAPISPGSSGGPVVNSKGEVVGVSVATFKGGQNLNFAIPSSYLTTLMAAPAKLVKFAGGAKQATPKVGSILDGLGGNSTEGVEGSDFLWNETRFQRGGGYSFTLRNKLREPVKNVKCAVIFHNDNGEVVDFDLVTYDVRPYWASSGIIPPGLGKRVDSAVAKSVQELTTEENGKTPRTKLVFRVLYFEFVDSDKADDEVSPKPTLPREVRR